MSDPYRGVVAAGTCPRCAGGMATDGELGRLVCERRCGEFYSRAMLDEMRVWRDVTQPPSQSGQPVVASAWPWGAAQCPLCRTDMAVGFRANLRYDYCRVHGVWLDIGEIELFASLFESA